MDYNSDFISNILNAINDFESLAQQLLDKVLSETIQNEREEVLQGNLDFLENTDTGELVDNWTFEIHGEHCDFTNIDSNQTLTICIGLNSLKFIDPHFFYNFLKTNKKHKKLISEFPDSFGSVYLLFQQMEELSLLKKVEGFQSTFVKISNSL
jgi:hypothetical protein